VVVIEINPRTSRSSALASKATGFPIAFVSALLVGGLTLDEIPYWRLGTLDKYEPWGDYVVVKFARWAFEKFPGAEDKLGTQMKAVGEVMSFGKNYKEAFQKAIRSLEIGRYGLGFAKDFHQKSLEELMELLWEPSSERQFIMYEALRKGADMEALYRRTQIMMGKRLSELNLRQKAITYFGVKEALFPFNLFPEVDPLLGPEMRSTGEVWGMANSFGLAFYKAQEVAQQVLPREGTVLITVSEADRPAVLEVARQFQHLGFKILATKGTHQFLAGQGIPSQPVLKLPEGRPHILDLIQNREIHLVINTPAGKFSKFDDSYIRKAAIRYKIPYITTLAGALAAARGIAAARQQPIEVLSLQNYHTRLGCGRISQAGASMACG